MALIRDGRISLSDFVCQTFRAPTTTRRRRDETETSTDGPRAERRAAAAGRFVHRPARQGVRARAGPRRRAARATTRPLGLTWSRSASITMAVPEAQRWMGGLAARPRPRRRASSAGSWPPRRSSSRRWRPGCSRRPAHRPRPRSLQASLAGAAHRHPGAAPGRRRAAAASSRRAPSPTTSSCSTATGSSSSRPPARTGDRWRTSAGCRWPTWSWADDVIEIGTGDACPGGLRDRRSTSG